MNATSSFAVLQQMPAFQALPSPCGQVAMKPRVSESERKPEIARCWSAVEVKPCMSTTSGTGVEPV